jgi:hypothetical protein
VPMLCRLVVCMARGFFAASPVQENNLTALAASHVYRGTDPLSAGAWAQQVIQDYCPPDSRNSAVLLCLQDVSGGLASREGGQALQPAVRRAHKHITE